MTTAFDENYFGNGAEKYAQYRPSYPQSLIEMLASTSHHELAWDCATGTGQAARSLSAHFRQVIATDSSADQIALATGPENVEFRVAAAEASGIEANSVDLITVATALHWFDLEAFWVEVSRVARQGAVLAFWCYEQPLLSNSAVQTWFDHFARDVLGEFWDDRVKIINDAYAAVDPPFRAVDRVGDHESQAHWSEPQHILGYCGSWSALERFRRHHGIDPRSPRLVRELEAVWPEEGVDVVWNIRPRVFRVEPA